MRLDHEKNPNRVRAGKLNRAKRKSLTADGAARLSAAAKANKPWRFSTGPKTEQGKARSSKNACKPILSECLQPEWMRFAKRLHVNLAKLRASCYLDVSTCEYVRADDIADRLRQLMPAVNTNFARELATELMSSVEN